MIKDFKIIFWDFDGVIKDSVEVKTKSFIELFSFVGDSTILNKIHEHHLKNTGVSRFDKIPIYLHWCGIIVSAQAIEKYCEEFSKIVYKKVIDSPFVLGVLEYLESNFDKQENFLVTATPQNEIENILDELKITKYFNAVYGSPHDKKKMINKYLLEHSVSKSKCLMIGDSVVDHEAAKYNGISFLLRSHEFNRNEFNYYDGKSIKDFTDI